MYDYLIGGKHHTKEDQRAAERALAIAPEARFGSRENRRFLQRAVRHIAKQGVRQFIDLGSGYPAGGQVHEIAEEIVSDPHVVYVDYDPSVTALSHELLTGRDNVTAIAADLRQPWEIIENSDVIRLIDWSMPVALLFLFIMHFISDDENPSEIIAVLREHMTSGSYLVLSHVSAGENPDAAEVAIRPWERTRSKVILRTPSEIEEFFTGFEMAPPGLVATTEWGTDDPAPTNQVLGLAGVARLP
jgi:hypothetical protein